MDGDGLCTWLHVAFGETLIFVGNAAAGTVSDMIGPCLDSNGQFNQQNMVWTLEHLPAGDDLYVYFIHLFILVCKSS